MKKMDKKIMLNLFKIKSDSNHQYKISLINKRKNYIFIILSFISLIIIFYN